MLVPRPHWPRCGRCSTGADFYRPAHETIWQRRADLADDGRPRSLAVARRPRRRTGTARRRPVPAHLHVVGADRLLCQLVRADRAWTRPTPAASSSRHPAGPDRPRRRTGRPATRLRPRRIRRAHRSRHPRLDRPRTACAPCGPCRRSSPLDALPGWIARRPPPSPRNPDPDGPGRHVALAVPGHRCGRQSPGERPPGNRLVRAGQPVHRVPRCRPGTRKSPVFNTMTAPMLAAEKSCSGSAAPAHHRARRTGRSPSNAPPAPPTQRPKPRRASGTRRELEAHDAALDGRSDVVPKEPRLFTDDITPGTTASMLADQGGRMAILSAESEIFDDHGRPLLRHPHHERVPQRPRRRRAPRRPQNPRGRSGERSRAHSRECAHNPPCCATSPPSPEPPAAACSAGSCTPCPKSTSATATPS